MNAYCLTCVKFELTSSLSHPQRTCYLHGARDHDTSGRLHVRGQKEEEARPETVKERFVKLMGPLRPGGLLPANLQGHFSLNLVIC